MIVKLPYPHKDLMPNRSNGKHWAQTKALKADAKLTAYLLTKSALAKQSVNIGETVALSITFVRSDKRRIDMDGLLSAAKHLLDGVAQALNIDDYMFNPIKIKRGYDPAGSFMLVEIL